MQETDFKYQFKFVLIRYVPDFVKEEFFNAGVILYDITGQKIIGKVAKKPSFLRCLDDNNYKHFLNYTNSLIDRLQDAAKKTDSNTPMKEILEKAFRIGTIPEAGLISFSNVKGGVTNDIQKEIEKLYRRFVTEASDKDNAEKKPKRDIGIIRVYKILDKMKGQLKKQPTESIFDHPLIEMGYKFEVSFNSKDNLHLKVLSIRSMENRAYELQNILSAIPILTDLKKQHKGHTFGGLLYFSPKYNKQAQESEFRKLKNRFEDDGLDCVRAEEGEMEIYFRGKNLLPQKRQ
jgi:hypothetical protein